MPSLKPKERQIWISFHDPIRLTDKPEEPISLIMAEIMLKYGRSNLDKRMIALLVKEVIENWNYLGIQELRIAFDLWSKGEIGDKTSDYYGEWNVLLFNRIMAAYLTYRTEVINRIGKEEIEIKSQEEMKEKELRERECFQETMAEDIRDVLDKAESWKDIPIWVYEVLIKKQLFTPDDEQKKEIYKEAGKIYLEEMEREKDNTSDRRRFKEIKTILQEGIVNNRAVVIAKKLILFENRLNIKV